MEQLRILFVINDLYTRGNGLAASARRMIALLRERGHDVRVLSAPPLDGDDCGIGAPDGRVQLSVYPSFCLKGLMHDE